MSTRGHRRMETRRKNVKNLLYCNSGRLLMMMMMMMMMMMDAFPDANQ